MLIPNPYTERYRIRPQAHGMFPTLNVIEVRAGDDDEPMLYAVSKALDATGSARIYIDPSLVDEVMRVTSRGTMFNSTYDVVDLEQNELIGSLEYRRLGAIWIVYDASGKLMGEFTVRSRLLHYVTVALAGRLRIEPFSRTYVFGRGKNKPCRVTRSSALRGAETIVDFTGDIHHTFDRRLGLAFGVLMNTVPG